MSTGTPLERLANEIFSHLAIVRANPAPSSRESMLMSTNSHLSAVVDKLVSMVGERDQKITDLQGQITSHADGLSEADAEAIIAKAEAVTGPVADPDAAASGA